MGDDEVPLLMIVEASTVAVEGRLDAVSCAGIATGQNDHTALFWSQYRSSTNLLKPMAIRFEKQSAAASSSYILCEKHAADIDTPVSVTKLIGTLRPRSRCDYGGS